MAPFTSRPDFLVASLILLHKSLKVPGGHLISFHLLGTSPRKLNKFTKLNTLLVSVQFSSFQSFSHAWLFATPWTAACQASLSITNSQSLLKIMSIELVITSIQPSHPLTSPSPPAFNLSQHQGLFKWVSSSHQVAKVLEFQLQHQSFQWIFRTDFL